MSEEYELEIIEDFHNKVIGRRELKTIIYHLGKGTPSRIKVREKISELLKVPVDRVYVRLIKTEYGTGRSIARIHVYDDPQRALAIEPEYIIKRNTPAQGGE